MRGSTEIRSSQLSSAECPCGCRVGRVLAKGKDVMAPITSLPFLPPALGSDVALLLWVLPASAWDKLR